MAEPAAGKGLSAQVGPFKAWQWIAALGLAALAYYLYKKHSATTAGTAAASSASVNATGLSPGEFNQLSSEENATGGIVSRLTGSQKYQQGLNQEFKNRLNEVGTEDAFLQSEIEKLQGEVHSANPSLGTSSLSAAKAGSSGEPGASRTASSGTMMPSRQPVAGAGTGTHSRPGEVANTPEVAGHPTAAKHPSSTPIRH